MATTNNEIIEVLKTIAPGTPIREGLENILKAKLEIVNGMNEEGTLILNGDNDLLKTVKDKRNIITFGMDSNNNLQASNILVNKDSTTFSCSNITYNVPVPGEVFVYNALASIAAGKLLNLSNEEIKRGIETFKMSGNRMNLTKTKYYTILNDTYNANPDSVKSVLKTISSYQERKVAILGDMLELGEFSNELHLKVGKSVYENNIDLLVTVGDYSKKIAEGACILGMPEENVKSVDNNSDAIKFLEKVIIGDSAILLKASNSMKFSEIYNEISKKLK